MAKTPEEKAAAKAAAAPAPEPAPEPKPSKARAAFADALVNHPSRNLHMAIPLPSESPRALHLRSIAEKAEAEQMIAWPLPTDEDFALFGRIIHIYSAMDFLLRFTAEVMDAQGLLSKSWKGKIAAQTISVVSRAIQSNKMWHESHRIAFERIDLHRRVRNLLAHFLVRRFPEEDAFLFMTKSASDFKQVYGDVPAMEDMLYGVTDADQIRNVVPELKGLLSWLGNLPRDLSRPIGTIDLPAHKPMA